MLLIETRNWYETKVGTFKGAVNPGIDKFMEFFLNGLKAASNKRGKMSGQSTSLFLGEH